MSSLDLRVKRPLKPLTEASWPEWTSECKVLSDMCKQSGLQDKSIAIEINVDPAILSKSKGGTARLAEQQMDALMDACGSEAWLHYWVLKRGYDPRSLHRLESDLEKENRHLREKLAEMTRKREIEIEYARQIRASA